MTDEGDTVDARDSSDAPDEGPMNEGRRSDDVRRRNRITGLLLLALVVAFIAVNIWSQLVGW